MKTEVVLPADLDEFIRSISALPRFANVNDVIVEALYLLKDEYDLDVFKQDRLREELQHAVDQADRGQMTDGPTFMAQLRERIKAHAGA